MMTESDIRKLLAKAEPFRPAAELYDINEIAGPQAYYGNVYFGFSAKDVRKMEEPLIAGPGEITWGRVDTARQALFDIAAEVDAFLARDPAP